jgi:hypothetical protein
MTTIREDMLAKELTDFCINQEKRTRQRGSLFHSLLKVVFTVLLGTSLSANTNPDRHSVW